ncbi:holo-ACP synthase [Pseudoclavibacter chungangensis]|uniref:Holo-[acyl-carrier-protein] synthase n=1 Tax=Pseudoclavibacter chungangensis TaxID=587635 RepID=A0A7J5C132_9MICO|nr:holo-ACP synthase [Pseudoclavibacter chungangensis]KAB1662329.1 holo-ACP synthase [Pseudoclavibacter chungangensis]NYJ65538.1 holo-[acyl-carrier protein] synthase [Pseudoclavibacter chungangensis]
MIVGIGIDTVDLTRFARSVERAPRLLDRLFTDAERALPRASLAARFAAREAAVKALGGLHGLQLRDLAVAREHLGPPTFELDAHARAVLASLGVARLHLSITHDANLATAFVVAEGGTN